MGNVLYFLCRRLGVDFRWWRLLAKSLRVGSWAVLSCIDYLLSEMMLWLCHCCRRPVCSGVKKLPTWRHFDDLQSVLMKFAVQTIRQPATWYCFPGTAPPLLPNMTVNWPSLATSKKPRASLISQHFSVGPLLLIFCFVPTVTAHKGLRDETRPRFLLSKPLRSRGLESS